MFHCALLCTPCLVEQPVAGWRARRAGDAVCRCIGRQPGMGLEVANYTLGWFRQILRVLIDICRRYSGVFRVEGQFDTVCCGAVRHILSPLGCNMLQPQSAQAFFPGAGLQHGARLCNMALEHMRATTERNTCHAEHEVGGAARCGSRPSLSPGQRARWRKTGLGVGQRRASGGRRLWVDAGHGQVCDFGDFELGGKRAEAPLAAALQPHQAGSEVVCSALIRGKGHVQLCRQAENEEQKE